MASTRLLVLPEDWSSGASASSTQKFLRLPHPRHGLPSLYLPNASGQSLLEVQQISPPSTERRSAFIDGQVVSDASPYLCTPIDPLFLLIALLNSLGRRSLPASDLFEEASYTWRFKGQRTEDDGSKDDMAGDDIVKLGELSCVQALLGEICEVTEVSETVKTYRLDTDKVLTRLRAKLDRVAEASDSFPTLSRAMAKEGLLDVGTEPEAVKEGRLQIALDMVASYLPEDIEKTLKKTLPSEALDAFLAAHQVMPVGPSDSMPSGTSHGSKSDKKKGGSSSSKNGNKKKPTVSRGVSELSKVYTTNGQRSMMSSFFTKGAGAPARPASAPPKT